MKGGYVFDIQGFSVHDGPGCRTLVFLKGCPLNCKWCSNPEGIKSYPLPLYNTEKCINDRHCIKACLKEAITAYENGLLINRDLCSECFEYLCAESCNTGAMKIGGYYISTEDLIKRLQKDRDYWGEKGGITLTGGEPFSQPKFAIDILRNCYELYVHTAIETSGNVQWKYYSEAINYTDWIFYDLKHIDKSKHREWTGIDNKLILENAERLAKQFKGRLIIRIPVVPGFNNGDDEIEGIADYLNNIGVKEINILTLHHLGREKYNLLGIPYFDKERKIPTRENMRRIKAIFRTRGLDCYEDYKTPF